MTDRYQGFVQSSLGQLLVKNLGLPDPVPLKRYAVGEPLVTGTVLTGGPAGRLAGSLPGLLDELDVTHAQTVDPEARYRALVLDATGLPDSSRLRACAVLRSADAQPGVLPPARRHRDAAGDGRRLRAGGPARTGGLHPLAGQGGRSRRHGPAGLRRRGAW